MDILVAGCILELASIWQPHCQDKQHTHTETYVKPNGDHTFNYIDQSNVKQSVNYFKHKAYVPSNYYTKNNYHLILILYIEMKFSLWINDFRYDERH
jgi:hypothetical protein